MSAAIAERAERGAAYLDVREPGWWQRIDLGELDLQSPCNCVLGQLHARRPDEELHYLGALRQFGLPDDPGDDMDAGLGFYTDDDQEWPLLNEAWRELIEARRAGEPR